MSIEVSVAKRSGDPAQQENLHASAQSPRPDHSPEHPAERSGEPGNSHENQRLFSTLDHAGVGIAEVDGEGRLLQVNAHLCMLVGSGREELVGRSVFDETHPEDAPRDLAQFRRQVAGEIGHYSIDKRIRRKDGSYFWASMSSSSVLDPVGRFLYAVRVQHDISDRKQAERAARHLAAIVESSDDAIISKNLDGIILSWNAGAERIFGYKPEEIIGLPVSVLIPEDRQDEEPRILARIRAGERVDHFETIRRHKDGRPIEISLTTSPVRDEWGRIIGASKIARDITERKEAEIRLRESEQQLKDLLAAIPAAIYTTDAWGRVTYYNERAVELAGRVPVIGGDESCVTWKLFWPDGTPLPHDQSPMAVALKEGRPIRDAEAVAERPDGTRVPFIPYSTPLRDAKGRVTGAINMLIDISERKQAETQQRILLNELNHRVKNNMQMLQSLLASAASRTQHVEAKQVLAEASNRLAAMAAAQRVLYGTTAATRFDGQEFLNAVCNTVRHTFPDGIKIACRSDVGSMSNDAAMPLALILNELLTNAVKHGMRGRSGTINVALERAENAFALSVQDEGPGFDLDAVVRRSSGLQLVQGLARQLRGRFETQRNPARCVILFS